MRVAIALVFASTVAGSAFHGQTESADCRSLKLMTRMARIVAWEHRRIVDEETQRVCAANDVQPTRRWTSPSRTDMKRSSGTWYYPAKGGRAIDSHSLYYPNDKQAKVDDKWYYPDNGGRARDEPARNRPWHHSVGAGTTTEQGLIDWACQRAASRCSQARTDIGAVSGDERALAVIELAWSARSAEQK